MNKLLQFFLAVLSSCIISSSVDAFCPQNNNALATRTTRPSSVLLMSSSSDSSSFERTIAIPPSNSGFLAEMKLKPILDGPSEIVEVRYAIPLGLDVAPKDGLAVCNKDGAGGEKVGDILRFTSQWTMGLPRGDGILSTAASFSGGIGWQCSLFDVAKATSWESVVEALTSNTPQRTDEVVLLFERTLSE
mmetsp:Transcript_29882/g.44169  ORF Transcript_29882/g.44169 Transcript_29882/m.44169 type:complete len:190 (-) Transcript_29882:139-708(-)